MAYGKGSFNGQDKILPGMYANVVGKVESSSNVGVRGKAAVALMLDWGKDTSEIIKVTAQEFYNDCEKLFGYKASAPEMLILREIFRGATEVYVYRLNGAESAAASAEGFATAKYKGVRGNDIQVVISANVDDNSAFDVVTMLGNITVDRQIRVTGATLKDNDFVTFIRTEGAATLAVGTKNLTGGSSGSTQTAVNHNDFLAKLEAYQVNAVGCVYEKAGSTELAPIYASWVKSQKDIYGNCIQAVLYNQAADHEGVINVDDSIGIVPWVLGKEVGCALNASLQNIVYDGEVEPTKTYTQAELSTGLVNGKFILHRVGDQYRVLADVNSLVSITDEKTEDFKYNQTIRVIDQLTVDASNVWGDDFIGKVPNTVDGRNAFWSRIISLLNEYLDLGAIEEYDKELVTIAPGTQKGSIVMQIPVKVTTMLEKAYVTIVVQ